MLDQTASCCIGLTVAEAAVLRHVGSAGAACFHRGGSAWMRMCSAWRTSSACARALCSLGVCSSTSTQAIARMVATCASVQDMTAARRFDLIKLDIEGEEKFLMEDAASRAVLCEATCVFMELHERFVKGCNATFAEFMRVRTRTTASTLPTMPALHAIAIAAALAATRRRGVQSVSLRRVFLL